jgi:hypothetical protein
MKRTFKVITKVPKDQTKVSIKVSIDTNGLTSWESTKFKNELEDKIHQVLFNSGYYANEIKLG